MNFGFKLNLERIAEKMKDRGFSSLDFDSDDFINGVIEILADDYDLFSEIGEKMQKLENVTLHEPKTKADYDESIGEF